MSIKATSDLWWKNGVFYCLDIETFLDWDGDGSGDLVGLTERVDYLAGLGISCLWLMPFYPSPNRDDGYDISDFFTVEPRLGTLGDFTELIRTCRDRGIRVIADFVMNHTSDQHPWFQAARSSPDSPYRDFYVWRDERPPEKPGDVVFPDQENSNWAYDRKAQQYYLHKFYSHQPDLNLSNPEVRDELAQVMAFWLQQGLSGFRVDAVPFLIEGSLDDPHQVLRDLRAFVNRRNGEAILLGEVNLAAPEVRKFLGDEGGDELHMVLDFLGNQALYLSLARGSAEPLAKALTGFPAIPASASLGRFARNHDELTLDKLSESERAEVFARFGPDEDLQLYGRGLRRRLPSMLDGDERAIRMVYSLVFSLPGTPVLFYGEEIGMAENLAIDGRYAVRAPMQWSPDGGFTVSDAPCRPLTEGEYGPSRINVATQRRDPHSLLNWFERLIRRRRECPELGFGELEVLDTGAGSVLAHRCDWEGETIVAVHELSGRPVTARLEIEDGAALVDLFGHAEHPLPATLELEPYAALWFRVRRDGRRLPP
ncbi:alpha-amylase family protein [Solirubrobacter ginsenosidimutans]|uniref:Alpha-amylase family protein n=1 Tax=Solirubrobacter ginsenosidimutans TaxID=490573 RepID=A0A9X3MT09_9ACTN|nr:alpha-amylase family protein [Solirubrobacter ginsenosidimutans]MDA0161092.1 alpha-amylase family protein [Solirubrobacter ginsenosidimutans]